MKFALFDATPFLLGEYHGLTINYLMKALIVNFFIMLLNDVHFHRIASFLDYNTNKSVRNSA
jgi:hypothetical protein